MDRKEFLSQLGLSGASLLMIPCLNSCSKSTMENNSGNNNGGNNNGKIDFTLDLTSPTYAPLLTPGGYVYKSGVIVAKTLAGAYIAVSAACPHQGTSVVFQGDANRFYCPNHGSTFTTTGSVTGGPANSGLTQYSTELNGNNLRVFA